LRARTSALHRQAERSGIIAAILARRADRAGYALLLRNLLPVYEAMEHGLVRLPGAAPASRVASRALFRAPSLRSDLTALCGPEWPQLPILTEAEDYARFVTEAAADDGDRLIAHAYVRYLGDLNGGRILKRLLESSLGLGAPALSFYAFPEIPDLKDFTRRYRHAIERAAASAADAEGLIGEAEEIFRFNIALSAAVLRAAGSPQAGPT
jgi:heme oxygenase